MARIQRIYADFKKSVFIRQIRAIRVLFLSSPLQIVKPSQGIRRRIAAHLRLWAQVDADGGPIRLAEDQAVVVVAELDAAHARGFTVWHAGDGGRDGRGDAARPAANATVQVYTPNSR